MKTGAMHREAQDGQNNGQQHEAVSRLRERAAPIDAWVRELVRDRPIVALAGAIGIGYLFGRLIRRL